MRWSRVAPSLLALYALTATASPAAALMAPGTVAGPENSAIPLGIYPGSIDLGGVVNDLVYSDDRSRAYATTDAGVAVLRTSDWTVLETIDTPDRAFGAALLDDESRLAVALSERNEVVELDVNSGEIVATHEIAAPLDVEATGTGDLLVSTQNFLAAGWVVDRSAQPPTAALHPDLNVMFGALTADPDRDSLYAFSVNASIEPVIHRVDSSTGDLPVTATSAALSIVPDTSTRVVVDGEFDRLHTHPGDVLDPLDLTPIGAISQGQPVLAADEIFVVDHERIAVHDRMTLDLVRIWEPACDAYPETVIAHDAWLSPDEAFLVLPSASGFCLEPIDGSGAHPAELVFGSGTTDGTWIRSGTLLVRTPEGEVVVEREIDRWGDEVWMPEGDYFVALVRAVDRFGWPLVSMTPGGRAILERDAELTTVEGRTFVEVIARPLPYDIVDTSRTFRSSIEWLVLTGITRGCGPAAFCPEDPVTRGQMAAFLDRALDLPDAGPAGFIDDAGTFQQNIWNLKAAGITTGCAPDRYCTDNPVTRGQMAAFLDRALELPDAGPAGFIDDAGTFQQNIWNLKAAGITTGCAPDRYCTDDPVTRAQMAAFLERALSESWPFA